VLDPSGRKPTSKRRHTVDGRVSVLNAIAAPLGFYVLALLIVETTLGLVLIKSDLAPGEKFDGLLLAVGMFIIVIAVVTWLVWSKPENLTFDRDAHLIDRARVPYGSESGERKAAEVDSLPLPSKTK